MSNQNNRINWEKVNATLAEAPKAISFAPYGLPYVTNPIGSAFLNSDVQIDPQWALPKKVGLITTICGAFYSDDHNPAQPMTVEEIYNSAREVCQAGAPIVHIHVRDDNKLPTLDYGRFHAVVDPLRKEFPHVVFDGCLVPFSDQEWSSMVKLFEEHFFDIAPVNTMCTYIGDSVFVKSPAMMIEKTRIAQKNGVIPMIAVYTDGDIDNAERYLIRSGLIDSPTVWAILPALPGCAPMHSPKAMIENLVTAVNRIREIDPHASIMLCCAGRAGTFLATLGLLMGLHIRVGMEDTIWKWPHHDDKITNNADHFRMFKNQVEFLGYEVATGQEYLAALRGKKI